jgi:hypothetical protein
MLNVDVLSFITLSIVMLSVVILSVVMLSVAAPIVRVFCRLSRSAVSHYITFYLAAVS